MNRNALFTMFMLGSFTAFAQPKVYMFDEVSKRNEKQQWQQYLTTDEDCVAIFSEDDIALNIDRIYHLTITSTTNLPNDGVVYLCKDEAQREVTVTLIGNDRMFFYDDEKRFMIDFTKPAAIHETASLVNAED